MKSESEYLRLDPDSGIIKLTNLTKLVDGGGEEMQVNIYEAKTRLSELLAMLANKTEQEIVIAKSGVPVAKLIPYYSPEERKLGAWKGQFEVPEDFDDPDEEIADLFEVLG